MTDTRYIPISPALLPMAITHLGVEEGKEPCPYKDHLGFWTIGIGRLCDPRKPGSGLSEQEMAYLLNNDIAAKLKEITSGRFPRALAAWNATLGNPARQLALLSMCFQMGTAGVEKFSTTLGRAARGDWAGAAASAMDSTWAKQTPGRAKRVTEMMRTGK